VQRSDSRAGPGRRTVVPLVFPSPGTFPNSSPGLSEVGGRTSDALCTPGCFTRLFASSQRRSPAKHLSERSHFQLPPSRLAPVRRPPAQPHPALPISRGILWWQQPPKPGEDRAWPGQPGSQGTVAGQRACRGKVQAAGTGLGRNKGPAGKELVFSWG